jgi:hypothetical protein
MGCWSICAKRHADWQRIVDAGRARSYFEARARHMLSRAQDPLAEVEREERLAAELATTRRVVLSAGAANGHH